MLTEELSLVIIGVFKRRNRSEMVKKSSFSYNFFTRQVVVTYPDGLIESFITNTRRRVAMKMVARYPIGTTIEVYSFPNGYNGIQKLVFYNHIGDPDEEKE